MNLINLPYNNLFEILLNTETSELVKLCPRHSNINKICNDDYFWQLKLLRDYQANTKPEQLSWKQYYMWLYIPKQIPVYESETTVYRRIPIVNLLGTITIKRTETLQDLLNKSNLLIDNTKYSKRLHILNTLEIYNPFSDPDIYLRGTGNNKASIIGDIDINWNTKLMYIDDITKLEYETKD